MAQRREYRGEDDLWHLVTHSGGSQEQEGFPHPPGNGQRPIRLNGGANRLWILSIIDEKPGLNIEEIAEELNLSRGAVRYHLRQLGEQIVTLRQGHHVLHFSSDLPPTRRDALAFLRVPSIRILVARLMDDPRVRPEYLANELGISTRSVQRNIRKLVQSGLASGKPLGKVNKRMLLVHLHPEMRIALALWCQGGAAIPPVPQHRFLGWLVVLDAFLGKLLLGWHRCRDDWT